MKFSQMFKCKSHPDILLPGGMVLSFSRPLVMSIINCTPDSFYKPSRNTAPEAAVEQALKAEAEGADMVDFGAESTRPEAAFLDEAEEIRRLIPALRYFRRQSSLPVSVDTRKAAVARLALDEGADIINDVSALNDPAMLPLCARHKAAIVLMHTPQPDRPETAAEKSCFSLHNLLPTGPDKIRQFFEAVAKKAARGGIEKEKIILDPGIGFGKLTPDNLLLLNRLETIRLADYPLLVGLSPKRFIGEITGRDAEERLAGTLTANTLAILAGANIIRVHDSAAAVDLIRTIVAVKKAGGTAE